MVDYRHVVTTALDTTAVVAVAAGTALGLFPVLGWYALAVGGAVLYVALHLDAPLLVLRRGLAAVVAWVAKRTAPRRAARAERRAAAARRARESTIRRPWRPPALAHPTIDHRATPPTRDPAADLREPGAA